MSTISNRSNYVVSVPRQPQLTKTFPFNKLAAVKAYLQELKAQGHKGAVTQAENCIQVRVRRKGHKEQVKTFDSYEDADRYVKRADAEQSVGLFQDYTRAMGVTTAELIERYLKEECPKLRGGDTYATVFRAMLSDSRNELRQRIEQRKKEMKELGYTVTPLGAMRQPMAALEWLHKPLAQVLANDVEDFIRELLDQVAPDLLFLSPGPKAPRDFGLGTIIGWATARRLPIFGVCLGHQGLAEFFGARLGVLPEPVHGKPTAIEHDGQGIFAGLPQGFTAARYHSLYVVEDSLPAELRVTARSPDGVIMALAHASLPICSVQFHPESILSLQGQAGFRLLSNLFKSLRASRRSGGACVDG